MTLTGIIFAAIFALLAGILGTYALRARRHQIPFDSPIGLPGPKIRQNQLIWERAHFVAAPFIGTAATISLIQALTCGLVGHLAPSAPGTYLWVLAGVGLGLDSLLIALAIATGRQVGR